MSNVEESTFALQDRVRELEHERDQSCQAFTALLILRACDAEEIEKLILERDNAREDNGWKFAKQMEVERDEALYLATEGIANDLAKALRELEKAESEVICQEVRLYRREMERDKARKAAREYFEASLQEVVGRSCYAEVIEEAYAKYPFLKEMPLDP